MSTPIPPNIKLEGLELYAPRGARTPSAPGSQASPSQTLPHVPECDQLRADEGEQPSAAAAESLSAADTPIDDAIGTTPSLPDREPSISAASLPPAPKLRLERDPVSGPPSAFKPFGSIIILLNPRRDVVCASIRKSCRRRRPARGPTSSLPC
jgi:hypothetical protein